MNRNGWGRIGFSVGVALALGLLAGCASAREARPLAVAGRRPSPNGLALPADLNGTTSHETHVIYAACDAAASLENGTIARSSVGARTERWKATRSRSVSLAETKAVRVLNVLIQGASDPAEVERLLTACRASGY